MNLTEHTLAIRAARQAGDQETAQRLLQTPMDVPKVRIKAAPQPHQQVSNTARLKRKLGSQGERIRLLERENHMLRNRLVELESKLNGSK